MRTKYFFLFPKTRRMNWIVKIRSERALQNLFSARALIQHARQPDVTQNTATELLDRFMLCVVYCSCIMFTCNTVIWRPETRAFEDKPTKYGKRKETEVKMNFSFTWIRKTDKKTKQTGKSTKKWLNSGLVTAKALKWTPKLVSKALFTLET